MKEEKETLASEMLRELNASNRRNHIIIIILIGVILAMIISFFNYESQFDTSSETYLEQTQEDVNNSSMIGEIN